MTTKAKVDSTSKFDIQKLINDGVNKSVILSLIQFNMELTKKQAVEELNKYEMSSNKNDTALIVKTIIAHKSMKRKELSKHIASMNLCSESTAFHYLSMMNVIEEYHKQMSSPLMDIIKALMVNMNEDEINNILTVEQQSLINS